MRRPIRSEQIIVRSLGLLALLAAGCVQGPHVLPLDQQMTIDRRITEYPTGFELKPYAVNLDDPTSETFDSNGNLIVVEHGHDGDDPHIFGIHLADSKKFQIYPVESRIPVFKPGFRIYGPVGGIVSYRGKVYVSHRDHLDMGVITAFGYDGSHTTIVAGLPARGDYGVTDLAVSPINGRLYFGVGSVTNSGVVGLDNYDEGWVRDYPNFCDLLYKSVKNTGFRFDAPNPLASIFAAAIAVTGPFQPFGSSSLTDIPAAPMGKPTGAIYSISPEGGDFRVEAWGVRNPAGLVVNEFGRVYFTDQGMELRGTRPIKDDPDGLYRLVTDGWYGWPDFSRTFELISDPKYQPPLWMIIRTGYSAIAPLIDHSASGLQDPDKRWIAGTFSPLSGASKMDFVPQSWAYHELRGNLIVALWGNRAPFATSNQVLKTPPSGFSVVRVDPDSKEVHNFIYNTQGGPASELAEGRHEAIERPIDVKFGPDGNLYILDFGRMEMKGGTEQIIHGTGRIFRLVPVPGNATRQ